MALTAGDTKLNKVIRKADSILDCGVGFEENDAAQTVQHHGEHLTSLPRPTVQMALAVRNVFTSTTDSLSCQQPTPCTMNDLYVERGLSST